MKVVVGISGGVDSAVSAYLLKSKGYEVEGLFIKSFEATDDCTFEDDYESAKEVAEHLGIRLRFADFSAEYWQNVFEPSLDMYRKGLTPNPDTLCNKYVKFDVMYRYALTNLAADMFATGHYAKIAKVGEKYVLQEAKDEKKDQTYFLYSLTSDVLSKVLFPLGDMLKSEVKSLANEIKLPNADRRESMGICFIGKRDFKSFLSEYIEPQQGDIITEDGKVVGRHDGVAFYTIGQRTGLHIGGVRWAKEQAWFVIDKDLEANRLIVSQDNEKLFRDLFYCREYFFNLDYNVSGGGDLAVRIRHNGKKVSCELEVGASVLKVRLYEKERAIARGQAAVFYSDGFCIGGGVIDE